MTASSQRAVAQHQAQIRDLKRRILINTPLIGAFVVAAVCSYLMNWHVLARVGLTLICSMQLLHLPGLFTRLAEQKRKLAAASHD